MHGKLANDRTQCVLGNFADAPRLRGTADMLERKTALQRDLDKPEQWADGNLLEFSNGKSQVHFGVPRPAYDRH